MAFIFIISVDIVAFKTECVRVCERLGEKLRFSFEYICVNSNFERLVISSLANVVVNVNKILNLISCAVKLFGFQV